MRCDNWVVAWSYEDGAEAGAPELGVRDLIQSSLAAHKAVVQRAHKHVRQEQDDDAAKCVRKHSLHHRHDKHDEQRRAGRRRVGADGHLVRAAFADRVVRGACCTRVPDKDVVTLQPLVGEDGLALRRVSWWCGMTLVHQQGRRRRRRAAPWLCGRRSGAMC